MNGARRPAGPSPAACAPSAQRMAFVFRSYRVVEERASLLPISLDGARRYAECVGRLFHRQSAEEAQLDDAHQSRIEPLELLETLVERDQLFCAVGIADRLRLERHHATASSLVRGRPARIVDEDLPHRARRDSE